MARLPLPASCAKAEVKNHMLAWNRRYGGGVSAKLLQDLISNRLLRLK